MFFDTFIQSKSNLFFLYCACFLCGVAAASLFSLPGESIVWAYIAIGGIALAHYAAQTKKQRTVFLCIACLAIGIFRYHISFPAHLQFPGERETINAVITAEPDVRMDSVRYLVRAPQREGNIYLRADLYPQYAYGDALRISCVFKKPEPIEDFRFDMYLARFGVFTICTSATIEKINGGGGNAVYRFVFALKDMVAHHINRLWHEPYASFMAGLLYGYRGGLGSLNEAFNRTGTTHIIAISGYNITLLSAILFAIFVKGFLINSRRAFYAILIGIALFVVFAGMSASVVRAGIMGSLVLMAKHIGRLSHPRNLLTATAMLMTVHNPFVLIWDAGFQLSFLATMGLMYLSPKVERGLRFMPERFGLREAMSTTLAAIISTLPLTLFQFERLSLVAPIVNLLILWLIPWIMLFGFAAVVVHALVPMMGFVISWIAFFGLWYITGIVRFFAALPFAVVDVRLPWWGMVASYIALGFFLFKKRPL